MVNYEKQFYTIEDAKIVNKPWTDPAFDYANNNTILNPYPSNYTTNVSSTSTKVYKLDATTNINTNKTGLGIVLKVMAGDQVNIFGRSFHQKPLGGGYTNPTNSILLSELISAFTGTGVVAGKGITGSQVTGQAGFPTTMNGLIGNQPAQSADRPKAAINWIVFDEQFKWVSGGFDMVGTAVNTNGTPKFHDNSTIPTISIPKNGYIYVYCSNESQYNVFFDNLQLVHTRGPVLEETHYYPFGLTMSGISSKALGFASIGNKYKFNNGNELQSNEFNDGSGLEMFDAINRIYDPQIGRFWQVDELAEANWEWTPYNFALNNPVSFNDPLGLKEGDPDEPTGKLAEEKAIGNVTVVAVKGGFWAKQRFCYRMMDYLNSGGATIDQIVNNSTREMMYRFDGITKHRQIVADGTRADGLAFLDFASWFVPGGILTKLGKLKKLHGLMKLYNTKRGRFAVNSLIQFGINGKDADVADILVNTYLPVLKAMGISVALDWKPLSSCGEIPQIAFLNKKGSAVAVDAFTALAYFGLGNLPVTSTPLTSTQKTVLDDVYRTLETAIGNIYQQGLQQLQSNQ